MDAGFAIGPGAAPEPLTQAIPVTFAGVIVGAVAARWSVDREPDRVAAGYLDVLASACGLSVRALVEVSATVPEGQGPTAAILGTSSAAAELRTLVMRAAATPFPVLIQGESGTGKELAARAIHLGSARASRRWCAVNCAALTDDLMEAELFGHARGAFTGAATERAGLFEEADGGTLFLDEISELSARGQAKLLRAIQEGEIRRLGENVPRKVDVRVVAATNTPLSGACGRGRFRQDLFYRLDVIRIVVAPLRDRPDDLPILIARFWRDASRQAGSRAVLAPEAVTTLSRHDWPGNVRQLQNTLAALAVRAPRAGRVGGGDVAAVLAGRTTAAAAVPATIDAARRGFEVEFVSAALARAGGHRTRAAADLGVTRQGLAKLIRRLGIHDAHPPPAAEGSS
jgi:transcriptional regulator with PAS, ATPase and Fis domain